MSVRYAKARIAFCLLLSLLRLRRKLIMWLFFPIDIVLLLVLHTFRAVFSLWPCEQRYLGLVECSIRPRGQCPNGVFKTLCFI